MIREVISICLVLLVHLCSCFAGTQDAWSLQLEGRGVGEVPTDIEVIAEAGPQDYARTGTSSVAIVSTPQSSTTVNSALVLGLRDGSSGDERTGAGIAKPGINASKLTVSFEFYIVTPQRNGSLMVRLLNSDNQALASFQLFATGRQEGEIQLNAFSPVRDRQNPADIGIFSGRTWTPVKLTYDGISLHWSLTVGDHVYNDIPVDAAVTDTKVARFELYSGFGSASKTEILINNLTISDISK